MQALHSSLGCMSPSFGSTAPPAACRAVLLPEGTEPIKALHSFRDNKTTLLLCTPAAARGLDLPAVRCAVGWAAGRAVLGCVCGMHAYAWRTAVPLAAVQRHFILPR